MTQVSELANFVNRASYENLSDNARSQIKTHILDSFGCAIGALDAEPMIDLAKHLQEMGGNPVVTAIGGGRTSPIMAAFHNSALISFLDFNDAFLAKGETCHPSDNLGALLSACEYAGSDGKSLMTALAVAYQVQCRLSEEAPLMYQGFDHTAQGAFALAAGISRALSLNVDQTANAIAMSGTANIALRVSRTGKISNWKGLAYANAAMSAINATFLARLGITGPQEVFEGKKGFMEDLSGEFSIDWEGEDLEAVRRTIIKRYNAEILSQSCLEGVMDLRQGSELHPDQIEKVHIDIFDAAVDIIDLPYIVAVALIDGEIGPRQYTDERIARGDIQKLMERIEINPESELSKRFPAEMPVQIRVELKDGGDLTIGKRDYQGFFTRPMSWRCAVDKFMSLTKGHLDSSLSQKIIQNVQDLESIPVRQLAYLLSKAKPELVERQAPFRLAS